MSYKKWIFVTLFLILSIFLLVGIFNFFIDPFNIFSHKNKFNKLQIGFNERVQKSAYLKYNSNLNYDSILFGSSRATYYNSTSFQGLNLYNYSFSGAMPQEYELYLEFVKKLNKKELKNIILALDFYTFNNNKKIEEYIELPSSKMIFFIKNYFTLNTFKFSLINIKRSLFNTTSHRSYTRENIVKSDKKEEKRVKELSFKRAKNYYQDFDINIKEYKKSIEVLKEGNKNLNFIVFVPPLSKPFLDTIFQDKELTQYYFDWLNLLVEIFDNIYTFSISNKYTNNYEKYSIDGDHFYPSACNEIVSILLNKRDNTSEMIIINKKNIQKIKGEFLK